MQLIDLSLVIPTYTISQELEELAVSCILSYAADMAVKEIIVSEDGGFFSPQLMELADIYIYHKGNSGFTANVNRGWRQATGDFTAIVNSDTRLKEGELADLCIPGKVASPEILGQHIDFLAGPFFVVPEEIKKERGMLNEAMKNYSSDSDYDHRVRDIFEKVSSVKVYHEIAATVDVAGVNSPENQKKDDRIYKKLIKEGKADG